MNYIFFFDPTELQSKDIPNILYIINIGKKNPSLNIPKMTNDYLSRKSVIFNRLKEIARIRGIPLPISWRNDIPTMNQVLQTWTRPNLFHEINQFNRTQLRTTDYHFHENQQTGIRTYFVNDFNEETSNISRIMGGLTPRINHALRTGMTERADVNIRFVFNNNNIFSSKNFNSFRIRNLDDFRNVLVNYVEQTVAPNPNYTYHINKIIIRIVRENAGGCNKAGKDKITKTGEVKFINPPSKNNNCLFVCFKRLDLINFKGTSGKQIAKKRNDMRKEFNLEKGSTIPISIALKIFDKYKQDDKTVQFIDMETKEVFGDVSSENVIKLESEHYEIVEKYPLNKCEKCLKSYRMKHKCNSKVISYVNAKIKKTGRVLICNSKKKTSNNQDNVIHYDLETVPTEVAGNSIHTAYIVGYNEGNEFKTFQGDDCIKQFVDMLLEKEKNRIIEARERLKENTEFQKLKIDIAEYKSRIRIMKDTTISDLIYNKIVLQKKRLAKMETALNKAEKKETRPLYVNAFNGANFDHYFIRNEFVKRGLKPDKCIINNGSIIKFDYGNLRLFDICKHLQGGLKDNLKSLNCTILKGDFNHDDGCRWEDMKENIKEKCKKYLHGDVMGLKELYEKLNKEIHDKYGFNVTSYISTSSLTFNLWKETISIDNQEGLIAEGELDKLLFVKLPTLDQEKAFRQSVRGGRTYKSKHRFVSEQYDVFKRGEIGFDDIIDYLIDADVVSLYPTAMAHYKYPVGDCKKLLPHENYMRGKMGIYNIEYKANKSLQHSVGGRRDENGSLKWDLKDSQGWYTSIDIEDMLANGYEVKICSPSDGGAAGYYWTETAFIFKDYIEDLYKKKENAEKGSVEYSLAKLFMNSLYGKMIQRPIYSKTETIQNNNEYWKFWSKNSINGIEQVGEHWIITGTPREDIIQERCITKPTQLGAFILAYSRRIMLNYIKEANPYFNSSEQEKKIENDFYYTDTDSLQMHVRNAELMKTFGHKLLGGITDDLGDGCKIIRGLWIAPKLYMLEYVKKGSTEIHHHFRGKGLNKDALAVEAFEKMDRGDSLENVRDFQMKKIHIKRNSKQQDIPQFSIVHYSKKNDTDKSRLTRVVNSKAWDGRNFIDGNNSIPWL